MNILTKETRKKKRDRIAKELLSTTEVEEILDVSRMRITKLVQEGKLTPIKRGTYLKDDVYAYKEAFEEARNNNTWLRDFE